MKQRPTSILGLVFYYLRLRSENAREQTGSTASWTRFAVPAMGVLALTAAFSSTSTCPHARRAREERARQQHSRQSLLELSVNPLAHVCEAHRSSSLCVNLLAHTPQARSLQGLPTAGPSLALSPVLAWNGEGYGAVWVDLQHGTADLYFTRLNANGERQSTPLRLTRDGAFHALPSIVWTGREYGLAWTRFTEDEDYDVYFQRISAQGVPVGTALKLSNSRVLDAAARLVWTGREFAAGWLNLDLDSAEMALHFQRLNASGERIGQPRSVRNEIMATGLPSLVWGNNQFAFSWSNLEWRSGQSQVRYQFVNAEGNASGNLTLATARNLNGATTTTFDGRVYATVWEEGVLEDQPSGLAFASGGGSTVDVHRTPITNRRSFAVQPTIATAGNEYGLTWTDDRDQVFQVYFSRLGKTGAVQNGQNRVTNHRAAALLSNLVWNGTEYALSWTDARNGDLAIYLQRFNAQGARVGNEVRVTP